jgi:hypothetical protein
MQLLVRFGGDQGTIVVEASPSSTVGDAVALAASRAWGADAAAGELVRATTSCLAYLRLEFA